MEMTTASKKPGVAFWAAVAVVAALVAYPLSFGPACWIASRGQVSSSVLIAYRPLDRLALVAPRSVRTWLAQYGQSGMSEDFTLWFAEDDVSGSFRPRTPFMQARIRPVFR
jgi:hypothetical protein